MTSNLVRITERDIVRLRQWDQIYFLPFHDAEAGVPAKEAKPATFKGLDEGIVEFFLDDESYGEGSLKLEAGSHVSALPGDIYVPRDHEIFEHVELYFERDLNDAARWLTITNTADGRTSEPVRHVYIEGLLASMLGKDAVVENSRLFPEIFDMYISENPVLDSLNERGLDLLVIGEGLWCNDKEALSEGMANYAAARDLNVEFYNADGH